MGSKTTLDNALKFIADYKDANPQAGKAEVQEVT
jgi:hypothetical protein